MDKKDTVIEKLKSGGVKIVKEQVQYKLADENGTQIRLIIHANKKITVKPTNGENFIFKQSNPEIVQKVAKLIVEATKIEEK